MSVDGCVSAPYGVRRVARSGSIARRRVMALLCSALIAACTGAPPDNNAGDATHTESYRDADRAAAHDSDSLASVRPAGNAAAPRVADPATARPTILFIGTSLTAGFGIDLSQAYPAVVGRMLDSAGHPARIVNAGLSGETSAGALRRIDWVLQTPADVIVLETGANDGLRGLDVASLRRNIESILERIRATQPSARVMLAQMEAPPNMGARYTQEFHDLFPAVAKAAGVELLPFLLDGVAGNPALNQDDGIHPNVRGAQIVGANVARAILKRRQ
jgi:acyl-CoA thioesterase-1